MNPHATAPCLTSFASGRATDANGSSHVQREQIDMKDKSESFSTTIFESFFHKEKLIMKHLSILVGIGAFAISLHANCTLTNTGNVPLNQLTVPYKGTRGGLYPDGANNRPAAHLNAGMQIANQIRPLSASNQVDNANGKIVMV